MSDDKRQKEIDADLEYERKKEPKPIPVNDGGDNQVTDEQKRVNLRWLRERGLTILAAVAIALSSTGCAHNDEWRPVDSAMYGTTLVLLAADAYTTSQIQNEPTLEEGGLVARQVLGEQPETDETLVYMATLAVGYYVIGRALPAKWRPFWFGWNIVDHGSAVVGNCQSGLCE